MYIFIWGFCSIVVSVFVYAGHGASYRKSVTCWVCLLPPPQFRTNWTFWCPNLSSRDLERKRTGRKRRCKVRLSLQRKTQQTTKLIYSLIQQFRSLSLFRFWESPHLLYRTFHLTVSPLTTTRPTRQSHFWHIYSLKLVTRPSRPPPPNQEVIACCNHKKPSGLIVHHLASSITSLTATGALVFVKNTEVRGIGFPERFPPPQGAVFSSVYKCVWVCITTSFLRLSPCPLLS